LTFYTKTIVSTNNI